MSKAVDPWICPYCGHKYHYEDHFCEQCGYVFSEKIITAATVYFFVALFFLLILIEPLRSVANEIANNNTDSISKWSVAFWYIGCIVTVIIFISLADVLRARQIRGTFKTCNAIPPRHDSSKWEYMDEGSCVKEGYCPVCHRMVSQSFHNHWTEWEFQETNSCIQVRECLRCGEVETQLAAHLWEKIGEGESGPAEGYPSNRFYVIYECQRCGSIKS